MTSLLGYHRLRTKEVKQWERRPPAGLLAAQDSNEAHRLSAAIGKLHPYPEGMAVDFLQVAPDKSDLAAADLCHLYRQCGDLQRRFIRSQISAEQGWTLLTFSKRTAVHALQTQQGAYLRDSLLAHAVENLAARDVRDNLVALGLVYHCASAMHPDAAALFEEAAEMSGPAIAAVLRDFIRRDDLHGIVSLMGFKQVESRGQVGFRWG